MARKPRCLPAKSSRGLSSRRSRSASTRKGGTMFTVNHLGLATLFCVVTMLGWGSWANTQKLAGKDKWAFPLYYWDYAWGVFLLGIALMLSLGSFKAMPR